MNPEDVLVIIAYPNDSVASVVRERLSVLNTEDLIEIKLTATLTKNGDGSTEFEPSGHRGHGGIFHGRAASADLDDAIVQEAAQKLQPGETALCLLMHTTSPETVVPKVSRYGGSVIKTSLPPDREELLRQAIEEQLSSPEITARLQR